MHRKENAMRKVDPLQKCVITNKVLEAINNGTVYQITDSGDYESARIKLDLIGHKSGTIYGGVCGSSFTICFAEDWNV